MCKDEITTDKLPEAAAYLTKQVSELNKLVMALSPAPTDNHQLVSVDVACRIIQKAKSDFYALIRKQVLRSAMTKYCQQCTVMFAANLKMVISFN